MENEESAEQLSLQENRPLCIQLDYMKIASLLILAGVITQQEIAQIQDEFEDNTGRMQELISRLIKLNTEASFDAFREAVKELGEVVLAQKLLRDQSTFGIPLNAEDAHPCLFTPDVLDNIFSFLDHADLSTARLVCHMWNSVIATGHAKEFTVRFQVHSGHKKMIEFGSPGLKSNFCKNLNRFVFEMPKIPKGAWVFYKSFFVEFGPKTQSLELGRELDKDLLVLIFSPAIKQCLKNLKQLKLFAFPDKGLIPYDSLNFLSHVETLALTSSSGGEHHQNCMYFLEKFLENGHRLKALQFDSALTLKGFPSSNAILPNLFRGSTLESLKINFRCSLDDAALKLMTVPSTQSRLKKIECLLDIMSSEVFRDFMSSHRQTLQHAFLIFNCPNPLGFMEVLPRLESLKYFRLRFNSIPRLDFCTQAPNLKYLKVPILGKQGLPQPTFVHDGLEEMVLNFVYNSTAEGILEFITRIPHCFPNLMKLEVRLRPNLKITFPSQLGELQLQPGFNEDTAKWERMAVLSAGLHQD